MLRLRWFPPPSLWSIIRFLLFFFTLSVSISWNGATINLQCDKQCDFHFMLCHFVFGRRAEIVSLFPHFLLLFFTLYRKIHNNDHAYIYRIGMVLNHSHCSLYQATMNFCWCGFAAHDLLQSNNTHVMNDCTFQYFCGKCFQKVCFRQNGWDAFIKMWCAMWKMHCYGNGRDIWVRKRYLGSALCLGAWTNIHRVVGLKLLVLRVVGS